MSVQSVPLSAMFAWVINGFKLVGKRFTSQLGAGALFLLLVLVVCAPMWGVMFFVMGNSIQGGLPMGQSPLAGNMPLFVGMYALTAVISMALFPPMMVGWFRLCQGVDRGDAVGAMSVLAPFSDRALWLRSIGFAALAFVIYLAFFGLMALAFYGTIADVMHQAVAQQAAALTGAPPAPPHFPASFFLAYFLMIVVGSFLQFVYMIGFADVALQGTGAVDALMRAVQGTFKNLIKLLIFAVCMFVFAMVVIFLLALVLGIVAALLMVIMKSLAFVLLAVFEIVLMLCIYPLMFAINYFAWKSMLGAEPAISA
jgi:hypothetical protein